MVPFVKTGGLGDVVGALPRALAELGHRVTVFLPRYQQVPFPAGEFAGSVHVPVDGVSRSAGYYRRALADGVEVMFVEHPPFFERPGIYGDSHGEYPDSRLRFAFLSRAAIEYFRARGERPSVFHAHDWQGGLVPVYLKAFYNTDPTLYRMPCVFTIHNVAYQGLFGMDTVDVLGLPWNLKTPEALEFNGGISTMKGGILFSEMITTVSPQYAWEIHHDLGMGLEGTLRTRSRDLVGILNGADYSEWDPLHDRLVAAPYSADDLTGKARCKADLLSLFGLPREPEWPVIGIVSRLVHQKGFDIVVRAWYDLLQRPVRLVVLGSGEREVEDGFRAMQARAPGRVATWFGHSNQRAHQVIAGSDMILLPSRFEPCGLTQMYGLRYGTVPVVRSTGGLVDTVEPWDAEARTGTGFRFDNPDGTGLMWAVDRAIAAYGNPGEWTALVRNGMAKDFSWRRSAERYVETYGRAMAQV
jgi:starch synthase